MIGHTRIAADECEDDVLALSERDERTSATVVGEGRGWRHVGGRELPGERCRAAVAVVHGERDDIVAVVGRREGERLTCVGRAAKR